MFASTLYAGAGGCQESRGEKLKLIVARVVRKPQHNVRATESWVSCLLHRLLYRMLCVHDYDDLVVGGSRKTMRSSSLAYLR